MIPREKGAKRKRTRMKQWKISLGIISLGRARGMEDEQIRLD